MSQTQSNTSLRDAMYAMSLAKPIPDVETVEEFVRRFPEHAEALTDFAIELAMDALAHGTDDDEVEMPVNMEVEDPSVSRVMSNFQNRLFDKAQKRASELPARAETVPVVNPFATLDRNRFRALTSRLEINSAFLSKLRDRAIEPATIPRGYCQHIAEEMDERLEVITSHLYALPEAVHARQFYKADAKPILGVRQSFEDAVQSSGLTEEQRRRLLSFQS